MPTLHIQRQNISMEGTVFHAKYAKHFSQLNRTLGGHLVCFK